MTKKSKPQHLITLLDLDRERVGALLESAITIKNRHLQNGSDESLKGRTAAMIFEKPSLRTRVTFEVAMVQMGGAAITLNPEQISLGKRETTEDAAKSLSRWVDAIIARTFRHELVLELAKYSSVPVINALTDLFHPCQALALGQTMLEKWKTLEGRHLVFVGDGNNVANSLAVLAGHMGMHFTLACPVGYEQPESVRREVEPLFKKNGTRFRMVRNPVEAVSDADLIYTDVWVSMGEEAQEAEKKASFSAYQVNSRLLAEAPEGCLVSHCLPAHRGEEITDEVMRSDACVCFDEAENRLHAQKAVLLSLLNPDS